MYQWSLPKGADAFCSTEIFKCACILAVKLLEFLIQTIIQKTFTYSVKSTGEMHYLIHCLTMPFSLKLNTALAVIIYALYRWGSPKWISKPCWGQLITLIFYYFQDHFVSDSVNWQQNENASHPCTVFYTRSLLHFPSVTFWMQLCSCAEQWRCWSQLGTNIQLHLHGCRCKTCGAAAPRCRWVKKSSPFIDRKGLVLL